MRVNIAFGGILLAAFVNSVPILGPAVSAQYDAIVVGGGPAGLSAASGLARVRRNVLMVDSASYRNEATRHIHDVAGFDGVTPAWFRYAARRQIEDYETATLVNGTVTKVAPRKNSTYFDVSVTYPGNKSVQYTSRKVVLATGMRDLIPSTPGLAENWGKGIYWCPWCDGHEHEDQPLGVIGSLEKSVSSVPEVLTLNKDIVLLVNGTDSPETRKAAEAKIANWEKYLELHDIKVENRTIKSLERIRNGTTGDDDPSLPSHPEHDLFQVNFDSGEPLVRAAFLTHFDEEQRSSLGEQAGVKMDEYKLMTNNSRGLETSVPGIFAVGDCNSDFVTNVPHAMYTGKRTAVFLHDQIELEDAAAQTSRDPKKRRGVRNEADLRPIWERMNPNGDVLRVGEFSSDRF